MRIDLKNWTLTIIPHKEYCAYDTTEQGIYSIPADAGVTIPAVVPGNFELDMVRAGLLEDPYWGSNITKLRELEDRHLIYRATFDKPVLEDNELPVIRFEGIDTYADIYVNGFFRESTENMFMTYEVPLLRYNWDELKDTGNELIVHIHPTMIEAQRNVIPPRRAPSSLTTALSIPARLPPPSAGISSAAPCRVVSGGLSTSTR